MNVYRRLFPPAARIAATAAAVLASLRLARGDRPAEAPEQAELYGWEDECGRPASSDKSYLRS
jgi:hypothetical protein